MTEYRPLVGQAAGRSYSRSDNVVPLNRRLPKKPAEPKTEHAWFDWKEGFTLAIIRDRSLPSSAYTVGVAIAQALNQKTLTFFLEPALWAAILNTSIDTIERGRDALEDHGYIILVRQGGRAGARKRSNFYRVNPQWGAKLPPMPKLLEQHGQKKRKSAQGVRHPRGAKLPPMQRHKVINDGGQSCGNDGGQGCPPNLKVLSKPTKNESLGNTEREARARARPPSTIDKKFRPSDPETLDLAEQIGLESEALAAEVAAFVDHYRAKGAAVDDPDALFRGWLRKISRYGCAGETKAQGGSDEAAFAAFWADYPRKIGKTAARRAWEAATNKASPEKICRGLRAQLDELTCTESEFIPHPSNWLRDERWDDGDDDDVTPHDVFGAALATLERDPDAHNRLEILIGEFRQVSREHDLRAALGVAAVDKRDATPDEFVDFVEGLVGSPFAGRNGSQRAAGQADPRLDAFIAQVSDEEAKRRLIALRDQTPPVRHDELCRACASVWDKQLLDWAAKVDCVAADLEMRTFAG